MCTSKAILQGKVGFWRFLYCTTEANNFQLSSKLIFVIGNGLAVILLKRIKLIFFPLCSNHLKISLLIRIIIRQTSGCFNFIRKVHIQIYTHLEYKSLKHSCREGALAHTCFCLAINLEEKMPFNLGQKMLPIFILYKAKEVVFSTETGFKSHITLQSHASELLLQFKMILLSCLDCEHLCICSANHTAFT